MTHEIRPVTHGDDDITEDECPMDDIAWTYDAEHEETVLAWTHATLHCPHGLRFGPHLPENCPDGGV